MNRRTFVSVAALGAVPALRAQDSAQARDATGAADPLRDPSSIGQLRAVTTPLDNADDIKSIERRLKCTCGCNLDIFTCRTTDFTCTYSPALHKEIVALYTGGKREEGIVTAFVAKYGESILLAPKPVGFNLLGYLVPGALVLMAGTILGVVLLRRHRERLLAAGPVGGSAVPIGGLDLTVEQRAQLERAMGEIER